MSDAAAAMPAAAALPEKVTARQWLAVAGGMFGTFMALLDISVTNSSLPQIQGEIGATGTEGTWIGTSYLVAEIVMIPLTAWFTRLLGMRVFLLIASGAFVLFSALCGISGTLTEMIVGRVGQGFTGGAMIPASFTIIATMLPLGQQQIGLAIYVGVVVLAPVIGPVIGGWLTESASWHWIFFMNVPIGVPLLAVLYWGMPDAKPDWRELAKADWFGILGLALFLGGITIILEEGQRENWFDSNLIIRLTIVSAIGLALVLYTQATHPHPVVKLRLLMMNNFRAVFLIMTIIGAGFFIMLYVVPVFLGVIAGYNAQQTGLIAMYNGVAAFVVTPILVVIMAKVDLRYIVAAGMAMFAAGCMTNLGLNPESVGVNFILGQLLAGGGQVMTGMPLAQASTVGIPPEDIPHGSALFSMARNLGGSLGLALTGVLIDRRTTFHMQQLGQAHTANSPAGQEYIHNIAAGMMQHGADRAYAMARAVKLVGLEIQRQALVMSYIDGFWIMGIGVFAAIPAVLMLSPSKGNLGATMH